MVGRRHRVGAHQHLAHVERPQRRDGRLRPQRACHPAVRGDSCVLCVATVCCGRLLCAATVWRACVHAR
eukprot:5892152-Prymnesium_polylepis.1